MKNTNDAAQSPETRKTMPPAIAVAGAEARLTYARETLADVTDRFFAAGNGRPEVLSGAYKTIQAELNLVIDELDGAMSDLPEEEDFCPEDR